MQTESFSELLLPDSIYITTQVYLFLDPECSVGKMYLDHPVLRVDLWFL